jgi:hypothetical protein
MEELKKISKLIIFVVFFILSCTTVKQSVNYKHIKIVKLTLPNNHIIYLEERNLNNFFVDFNNKKKFTTTKSILFFTTNRLNIFTTKG